MPDGVRNILTDRPNRLIFKHVLRKIFLEDWGLKLMALVITLALWLGVTGLSTPVTKRFTVPLVIGISNNAEITNSPEKEIDIILSGDKRKIDQINRSELTAMIDISDLAPGDRLLQLTPETVAVPQLPPGVKLEGVQPGGIAVSLENVEERDIEVRPQLSGRPAEGFEVYATKASPAKVRVRGPESLVRTIEFVPTGPIEIDGAREAQTARQVPVMISTPKTSVVSSTVVDVQIDIGERRIERTFTVPVKDASSTRARVVLFGPKSLVDEITSDDLRVDVARSPDGTETPRLTLPANLRDKVVERSVRLRG
ncbi:MAG: YbbR-like domain-containing protein [Pyrinomonadaceae bacterium]